ncbi:MAG: MmcQ/YjbR family DNA-binding protein [Planctomycetes bacterium]|nr:MmcQ/YjbR family DNA-binding protein [Planctomycetota bacterium]
MRKTLDARLVRLSEIGLGFPEAVRQVHADYADFRVRNKPFAYFLENHHGDGIVSVCAKGAVGEAASRIRFDPELYYSPAYLGAHGWFAMRLNLGGIDWQEVAEIVERSYRLTAPKTLLKKWDAGNAAG